MGDLEDAMERHPASGSLRVSFEGRCSEPDCDARDAEEVYDTQGIYAGRWCDAHRGRAPGQTDYAASPAEIEPLGGEDDLL